MKLKKPSTIPDLDKCTSIVNIFWTLLVSMITKPSKTMIIALLVISMVTIPVWAESISYLPPPQKQMAHGTAAVDVICNSGLTLIAKLSSGSSACVKPSTAMKLEEKGWGQILKESSMMEQEREKMIEEIMIENEPIDDPKIIPSDFISEINNKFLTLTPGTTLFYESQTDEGLERIEVTVTHEKREVMGVKTTVVWDREWLNDELVEDTKDWFAQDLEGNVWYFGEDAKDFQSGQLVSTKGSWEAGVDGAKPGIVMKAFPQIGDSYRQEYYVGKAEDMGEVVSLDETVSVTYGTFSGCLKTKDWNPLEAGVIEFKYYCPQVGNLVLEEESDGGEDVELIDVISEQPQSLSSETTTTQSYTGVATEITAEQAVEIAKSQFEGTVTDVGLEYKYGEFTFVVEMQTPTGEKDVVISRTTGEVLGIE